MKFPFLWYISNTSRQSYNFEHLKLLQILHFMSWKSHRALACTLRAKSILIISIQINMSCNILKIMAEIMGDRKLSVVVHILKWISAGHWWLSCDNMYVNANFLYEKIFLFVLCSNLCLCSSYLRWVSLRLVFKFFCYSFYLVWFVFFWTDIVSIVCKCVYWLYQIQCSVFVYSQIDCNIFFRHIMAESFICFAYPAVSKSKWLHGWS